MLRRTIKNPTMKSVQPHSQPPVGMVVCPHCHGETNVSAEGMFAIIGAPHPYQDVLQHSEYPVTVGKQAVVCTQCTGILTICKDGQNLVIIPNRMETSVLKAEEILARKEKESAQANLRPPEII